MDSNSCYPYVASSNSFPVGPTTRFIGKILNDIYYEKGHYRLNGQQLCGIALVKVTPPLHLDFPFLSVVVDSGKRMNILCLKCAQEKRNQACNHSERGWSGVYTLAELNYAKELQYHFNFLEVHHFPNQEFIFKDFFSMLAAEKFKCSDTSNSSQSEVDKCIKKLNESLPEAIQFTKSDLKLNPSRQAFLKLLLNGILGKFAQTVDKKVSRIIKTDAQIYSLLGNNCRLEDLNVISDSTAILVYSEESKSLVNLNSNVIIYAHVCAYGRLYMHKTAMSLPRDKSRLYMINTDSLVFSLKKGETNPLENCTGRLFGEFKEEYSGIESFYTLGPKNYSISFTGKGINKTKTRICGLTIGFDTKSSINHREYKKLVKGFLEDVLLEVTVKQERNRKENLQSHIYVTNFIVRNMIFNKRVVKFGHELSAKRTYPYGYIE